MLSRPLRHIAQGAVALAVVGGTAGYTALDKSFALTVDGKTSTRPLIVAMDPRVKTPRAGLEEQFRLSMQVYSWMQRLTDETLKEAASSLLESLQAADTAPSAQLIEAVKELEAKIRATEPNVSLR